MADKTKITVDLQPLEDLLQTLGGEYVTRVGVLKGKNGRDDEFGNAEIGLVHELGSESGGIPPRSFLRMPIEAKGEDVIKAATSGMSRDAFKQGDIKSIYKIMGVAAEGICMQAFASGGYGQWPALSPATIKAKGSSRALIDTGQLRRSITSDVVKKGEM